MQKLLLILAFFALCHGPGFAVANEELLPAYAVEMEDILDDAPAADTAPPSAELAGLKLSELQVKADAGDVDAQLLLGDRYYYGRGGAPRDRHKAFNWYAKAAEGNCAAAQFNLGHMYRNGIGTRQDMQKALAWFEKAAHASDTEAQFMAAEMYGGGFGAPQNNVKACMWYQIAHDTMEPRFRDIAQTEIDLLKGEMTAAETAQAEQMAAQWLKNRKAP